MSPLIRDPGVIPKGGGVGTHSPKPSSLKLRSMKRLPSIMREGCFESGSVSVSALGLRRGAIEKGFSFDPLSVKNLKDIREIAGTPVYIFDIVRYRLYNAGALNLTNFILFLSFAGGLIQPVEASTPSHTCSNVNQAAAAGSEAPFTANEVVVIVDPFGYQAGELLPDFARRRDFEPIIVLSSPHLPEYLTKNFPRDRYVVIDNENPSKTADAIRQAAGQRAIRAVVPGTESGVVLSAELSSHLKLPGHPLVLANTLREKASMHEMLSYARLDFARSGRVDSVERALNWIRGEIKNFPKNEIVLKPPSSAGTDRVFFCKSEKEIEAALTQILGGPDAFGEPIKYAVIQEKLVGDEYIVDTVSTQIRMPEGHLKAFHRLVGAWRYHRRPSAVPGMADVIDHVSWVPVEQLPEKMADYARNALDAFDVSYGPAHLEIMATARGPVLVEIGARLPGGLPLLAEQATGGRVNQIDLTWDSFLEPKRFMDDYARYAGAYPSHRDADIVFLSVEKTGQFRSADGIARINKDTFPTLDSVRAFGDPDKELSLTTNVTNALLRAHFVGTPADIERDKRKLQEMHERGEFYR